MQQFFFQWQCRRPTFFPGHYEGRQHFYKALINFFTETMPEGYIYFYALIYVASYCFFCPNLLMQHFFFSAMRKSNTFSRHNTWRLLVCFFSAQTYWCNTFSLSQCRKATLFPSPIIGQPSFWGNMQKDNTFFQPQCRRTTLSSGHNAEGNTSYIPQWRRATLFSG